MRRGKFVLCCATLIVLLLAGGVGSAQASPLVVSPDGPYRTIAAALDDAAHGATIEVHGGIYPGPLYVEKSVTLIGIDQPIIDGGGEGSIVIINAPNVTLQGFIVKNTGTQMHHEDSGIIIQADDVIVADNVVENVLFGIYFADADNGLARNNTIQGREDLDIALRGDGIRVWFSNNVMLQDNEIYHTRDTLIWYANGIQIVGNDFHDNRYGLHFMYSHDANIEANTFADNHVGTYLMYSQKLNMHNNLLTHNTGPSGYGLALKDMDEVVVADNAFVANRVGLYIDNSPSRYEGENSFLNNYFAYNDLGVTMLPAVERNVFQANAFQENRQQAGTRGRGDLLGNIWTTAGMGNYWSDYVGYDADADGVGDMPYKVEKLFESLVDSYPELRLFIYSPASQAIDFAAAAFPSLRPDTKLVDDAPIMSYVIPARAAESPSGISLPFLITALMMLGIGFGICAVAMASTLPRQSGQVQSAEAFQVGT